MYFKEKHVLVRHFVIKNLKFQKGVLQIYSKVTGEYPCRSGISIKLYKKQAAVGICSLVINPDKR